MKHAGAQNPMLAKLPLNFKPNLLKTLEEEDLKFPLGDPETTFISIMFLLFSSTVVNLKETQLLIG